MYATEAASKHWQEKHGTPADVRKILTGSGLELEYGSRIRSHAELSGITLGSELTKALREKFSVSASANVWKHWSEGN